MKIIYLFITATLFVSAAYKSFGYGKYGKPTADEKSMNCELPNNLTDLESCFLENGVKLDIGNAKSIPTFGICTFLNGTSKTNKQCTENGDFLEIGNSLERKKRFFFLPFFFVGVASALIYSEVVCRIVCHHGRKAVNIPPTVVCTPEFSSPIYPPKGQYQATVKWSVQSWDSDGSITKTIESPSRYKSGMAFQKGSYEVIYTAIDNLGAASSCKMHFEVNVVTCQPLSFPEHGQINCDSTTHIYGSKCTVSCFDGYTYPSNNVFECQATGYWSPKEVQKCKAKACDAKPSIKDNLGYIDCRSTPHYGDSCDVKCIEGYTLYGNSKISCYTNGTWEKIGTCKDSQPPKFTDCPLGSLQVEIDSPDNTAAVHWYAPKGTDNSGITTITEVNKYTPGMRFKAGRHAIKYSITDGAGNVGDSCQFHLQVQTISCDHPSISGAGSEHFLYHCPDRYRFGAQCTISCNSGYPKGGADTITCFKDDGYPPKLNWEWDKDQLNPYCEIKKCPDLRAPKNGALSCAEWTHGLVCQIQCEEGYDVASEREGFFVCGQSDGTWRPNNDMDDCGPQRSAKTMHLQNKLFYYTGQCNSSKENLQQIQENFINALKQSVFKEYAQNQDAQSRFVNVTCGPIGKRRKTSVFVKRETTKEFAYVVEFDLIIPYNKSAGPTAAQTYRAHQDVLYNMIDAIKVDVDSGHFDINIRELGVEEMWLEEGFPEFSCNPGEISRPKSGACVGCPPGKYYSTETAECVDCEMNTYQDESGTISCKLCPENYVTTGIGSKNSSDCIEMCAPGSFSDNGLAPCQLCPSSSYQPARNETSCLPCNKGFRTIKEGSTDAEDCLVFDLIIEADKPAKFVLDKTANEITVFTWLYLPKVYTKHPTFSIFSPANDYYVEMTLNTSIIVDINGLDTNFSFTIPSREWTPFVLTISGHTHTIGIHLINNGSFFAENKSVSFPERVVFRNGDVFQANPGMIISAFHVWDKIITSSEIKELLSTCTPNVSSTYSLSDFIVTSGTPSIIIPSLCDEINECTNNPCGEHTCINMVGGYECQCHGGFTGKNCEIPKDYCLGNTCLNNASCKIGPASYTCQCLFGYRGSLCDIKAVDGGWSSWTEWTGCSTSCGGGYSKRERYCNSPSPDPEGSPCEGSTNETIVCNSQKCPECTRLTTSPDVLANCNETGHSSRCTLHCRPGLFFASPPLPYYECGMSTKYIWNHQTEENPTGRLPACTEVFPPKELSVSFDGRYESVKCTSDNIEAVKRSVSSSLSSLECVQLGSCNASIKRENCLENEGQPSKGISLTVELKSSLKSDGSGYNLAEAIANDTEPSSDLITFVKQTVELEKSAQTLLNNSKDLFEVTINGEKHTLMEDEISFSSSANCLPGSIRLETFCAECPLGSYADGEEVIMCPIGLYQDEKGQTSCKQCPSGYTTHSIGSVSPSECFEIANTSAEDITITDKGVVQTKNIDSSSGSLAVGMITTAGIGFALLVATAVYLYKRKQMRKTKSEAPHLHSTLYSELKRSSEFKRFYRNMS